MLGHLLVLSIVRFTYSCSCLMCQFFLDRSNRATGGQFVCEKPGQLYLYRHRHGSFLKGFFFHHLLKKLMLVLALQLYVFLGPQYQCRNRVSIFDISVPALACYAIYYCSNQGCLASALISSTSLLALYCLLQSARLAYVRHSMHHWFHRLTHTQGHTIYTAFSTPTFLNILTLS